MKARLLFSAICLTFILGCAAAQQIRTEGISPEEISGSYDVILYGGAPTPGDPLRVAFLDRQGDSLTIRPNAPDFEYQIIKNLPAADGVATAQKYLQKHPYYRGASFRRIEGPNGEVFGYAVIPSYMTLSYGRSDVLHTTYDLVGNMVSVKVTVAPEVEKNLAS